MESSLYVYRVVRKLLIMKYKFRFNHKSIHLQIPHREGATQIEIANIGWDMLKKSNTYTADEIERIGRIQFGTFMHMFRQIP